MTTIILVNTDVVDVKTFVGTKIIAPTQILNHTEGVSFDVVTGVAKDSTFGVRKTTDGNTPQFSNSLEGGATGGGSSL